MQCQKLSSQSSPTIPFQFIYLCSKHCFNNYFLTQSANKNYSKHEFQWQRQWGTKCKEIGNTATFDDFRLHLCSHKPKYGDYY